MALKQKLGREGEVTVNNPVMIADPKSGAVHLLYCVEYMRCFYARSDDDGRTFGPAVEITSAFDAFRPEYDWKVLATGPGHGVRLRTGWLVVPVWLSTGTGGHGHRPSCVATVYSDDDGKTWKRGDVVVDSSPDLPNPNETTAAELPDGRVMLNIRTESPKNRRLVTTGPDGATKWDKPAFDDRLFDPVCFGSLVGTGDGGRLLFSCPDPSNSSGAKDVKSVQKPRRNLTVRTSSDGGRTWPAAKVLEPGIAGYSDLAAGAGGVVYCFYERDGITGSPFRTAHLTLRGATPGG